MKRLQNFEKQNIMDLTEFFIFFLNRQGKLKLIYTIVQQLLAKKSFVMNILNIHISFLSYSYPFPY